jgi:hypothetical protein
MQILLDAPNDLFGKSRDGMSWWKSVNTKYLNNKVYA